MKEVLTVQRATENTQWAQYFEGFDSAVAAKVTKMKLSGIRSNIDQHDLEVVWSQKKKFP